MAYLFSAVLVVWGGSLAYIVWLAKEERRLQKELNRLHRDIEKMQGN